MLSIGLWLREKPTKVVSSFQQVCHTNVVIETIPSAEDKPSYIQGFQSKELIVKAGLTLGDIDQYTKLDVTIDGADE